MAELINSGKVIQKPEIVVDPSVFLPGGIVGARSKRGDEVRNPDDSYVRGSGDPGRIAGGENPGGSEGPDGDRPGYGGAKPPITGLTPPKNFTIISQTPKFGSDGTMTVDVVLEFEDVEGATGYDVRLTKGGDTEGILVPTDPEPEPEVVVQ